MTITNFALPRCSELSSDCVVIVMSFGIKVRRMMAFGTGVGALFLNRALEESYLYEAKPEHYVKISSLVTGILMPYILPVKSRAGGAYK